MVDRALFYCCSLYLLSLVDKMTFTGIAIEGIHYLTEMLLAGIVFVRDKEEAVTSFLACKWLNVYKVATQSSISYRSYTIKSQLSQEVRQIERKFTKET